MKEFLMVANSIVHWTARLAVMCYFARVFCDVDPEKRVSSRQAARWWWTMGCVWFVLHVAAAFHFEHHWSHSRAYESTARRSAAVTGWNSGAGLYVNEAFLLLWIADTILWWRNFNWPENRGLYLAVQLIFAFLMLQATVVFGPPFWRPVVLFAVVMILRRVFKSRANYH